MTSANSSDWIVESRKQGVDLSFLYQDKTKIYAMLEKLGLPFPQVFRFSPQKFDLATVSSLFSNNRHYFSRLVPFSSDQKRPYRLDLSTVTELQDFLSGYSLASFKELHLVERGEVVYSGVIIAQDERCFLPGRCLVELVQGDGPDLFHGRRVPIHMELDDHRYLRFTGVSPQECERVLILQALAMVGGRNHPFPGYYEFESWKDGRLMFRNYQGPETAYAKL
ncbi:hypothetical protein HYT55_04885 [Candidatus Woesearchaeota archaeon]|nr:hypothetical protein [Candidatus Woesearchaeota archaeon]